MKTIYTFVSLCVVFLFTSCSAVINKIASNYMQEYKINDVYESFDMSVFHDFVDKCTIEELKQKHGEPNHTYKTDDYENFKVLEYNFNGYSIDCYVKDNSDVVEFVSFSPKDIYPADKFFKKKEDLNKNTDDNTDLSFYVDENKNVVRLLRPNLEYNKNNINGFSCITINDILELNKSDVHNYIIDANANCPYLFGLYETLNSIEKDKDKIIIEVEILEDGNYFAKDIVENNKQYTSSLAIRMFNQNGILGYMTDGLSDKGYSLDFKFVGRNSKEIIYKTVDFESLFSKTPSNTDVLNAEIVCDNATMFIDNSENFVSENIHIEDGCIKFPYVIYDDEEVIPSDSVKISRVQKKKMENNFYDIENPTRKYLQLAYKNGLGIEYIWSYPSKNVFIRTHFTWNELKNILFRTR